MNIGIVYRIFYGDLNYIGSTINLKERMWGHRSSNDCSSKEILCYEYEVEVLAEVYYVENKNDINLRKLEREYMEQYVCVNKNRPIITEDERLEYTKHYYLNNKDELLERHKQYALKNRYELLEYKKQYALKNRDKITEKRKQYALKNKDNIKAYKKQYYLNKKLNKNN